MSETRWIIWSNEHHLFWRPKSQGYTRNIEQAGRYTEYEADQICRNPHLNDGDVPDEMKFLAPDAIEALTEEKERLQGYVSDWRDKCRERDTEITRLRAAVKAIKQATIDGKVCDDVAWFGKAETLHDFCARTLEWSPDQLSLSTNRRRTTMTEMPWNHPELSGWSIVSMNHYHISGERRLFVAMTKGDRCITAEHADEGAVFCQLQDLAWGIDNDERHTLTAENERLRAALVCAERKLSAYVGVCKGDKELTDSVLPQCRSAISPALSPQPEGQDNG